MIGNPNNTRRMQTALMQREAQDAELRCIAYLARRKRAIYNAENVGPGKKFEHEYLAPFTTLDEL